MATYSTMIPGLPGGPLQTSFPVKLMIAPAWRTNVRPGIKARTPRRIVQHETANPKSFAINDATYLYNGSGGRQASWHITVDDKEAYVGIPLDEVTWQASDGSGPGNYNGASCELCVPLAIVNDANRRRESQRKAAEIMGKIGARVNATPPARQHHDFAYDRKNCPAHMRNRGEWNRYVDNWHRYYNEEKAAMGGKPYVPIELAVGAEAVTTANLNVRGTPSTTGALWATLPTGKAVTITDGPRTDAAYRWWRVEWDGKSGWAAADWLQATKAPAKPTPEPDKGPKVGERIRVTAGLYLRQGWGINSRVMTLLPAGTEANVINGPRHADGYRWLDIKGDFGSGWAADAWMQVIGDAKEEPKPVYAKPLPVEALLKTNLNYDEIADGIVTANETEFIYTANVLEFKRKTLALQYASDGAPEVREPYNEGDRAIEAWRCRNHEGVWYSLLTGPDDEWVRVRSDHAVVVSGSPLLGDDLHGDIETA